MYRRKKITKKHHCTLEIENNEINRLIYLPINATGKERFYFWLKSLFVIWKGNIEYKEYLKSIQSYKCELKRNMHLLKHRNYFIHPLSKMNYILCWFFLVVFTIGLVILPLSLYIRIQSPHYRLGKTISRQALHGIYDTFLSLHLIRYFFTGVKVEKNKTFILENKDICKFKLKSYECYAMILTCFPARFFLILLFNILKNNGIITVEVLMIIQKIVMISRIAYLYIILYNMNEILQAHDLSTIQSFLIRFLYLFFCYIHFMAYILIIFPFINELEIADPNSWIARLRPDPIYPNTLFLLLNIHNIPRDIFQTPVEHTITSIVYILNYVFYYYIFIYFFYIYKANNKIELRKEEEIEQMKKFMAFKRFPKTLQTNLVTYFEMISKDDWSYENVLSLLSPNIHRDLLLFQFTETLKNIPAFNDISYNQLLILASGLDQIFLYKDEALKSKGDETEAIYIIKSGALSLINDYGLEIHRYTDNDILGIPSLMGKFIFLYTIVAHESTQLFIVNPKALQALFSLNKSILSYFETIYLERARFYFHILK